MVEALVFAVVSALLYHLGVGVLFFLIPLQMVRLRKGTGPFLLASAGALVLIAGGRLIMTGRALSQGAAPFLVLEMALVVALMGGLVWIQLPELRSSPARLPGGRVLRLLAATAAAGLASIPLALYLASSKAFADSMNSIFEALAAVLNQAFSQSLGLLPAEGTLKGEELKQLTGEVLLRSYLADYFLLLTFGWWAGSRMGARMAGKPSEITRLADFRLSEPFIWPLIGSLALVLAGLIMRTGVAGMAAWNLLLIMLILYGLAGLGILRFLARRFQLPAGLRVLAAVVLCVLALIPRVNLALAILIPGLGVSETWIKYRREERSKA